MNAPATAEVIAEPSLPLVVGRGEAFLDAEGDELGLQPQAWADGRFEDLPEAEARLIPGEKVEPNPKQYLFLETDADIAVYGGSAYSGKTYGQLLIDTQLVHIETYRSVTFRREMTQVRRPGGLWDESTGLFAKWGARPLAGPAEHWFPSGARTKFAHIEHEKDIYSWDGAQLPAVKFDQLESFTETMFWYLTTRNRDPSGRVKPFVRATCNPMYGSWLGKFLAWWIDFRPTVVDKTTGKEVPNPNAGYAIPERSGKLRWMVRVGETIVWADTREDLWERFRIKGLPDDDPKQVRPMSVTFIVATIFDNKVGLEKDPTYLTKLMNALPHERARLLGDEKLGGNWLARPTAGSLFDRSKCPVLPEEPEDVDWVRAWDLGATEPSASAPDPDWTVGIKIGKYRGRKRFVLSNVVRRRLGPAGVKQLIKDTATEDGVKVVVRLPQDPGQAGKAQVADFVADLAGFEVRFKLETGDKVTRFGPFSSQALAGNVDRVAGIDDEYLRSLENFPPQGSGHDDDADATSSGFNQLAGIITGDDVLRYFEAIGGGIDVERLKRQAESVTHGEEQPLAFSVPSHRIVVQPDVASAVEAATAGAPKKPNGEWRVQGKPHQNFVHGAGRRFAADADGIIDHDANGAPLKEEDALVLIRAGCVRIT